MSPMESDIDMKNDELPSFIQTYSDVQIFEDDEEPEIIPTYEDDDLIADIPENSSSEYGDDTDDEQLFAPVKEPRQEWNEKWNLFVKACDEQKIKPLAAFAEHISEINEGIATQLSVLIRRLIYILTPEEIMRLTTKIAPEEGKTAEKHSIETQVSDTAIIHLQKGFDRHQIDEFIIRIDAQFMDKKFRNVNVITNDWDSSEEFFALIPAAKKLFAKYVEAGLIGCLLTRGYTDTAKKVYCIAYSKGAKRDDSVVFTGIHHEDYKTKAEKSFAAYTALMAIAKVPLKKKILEIKK